MVLFAHTTYFETKVVQEHNFILPTYLTNSQEVSTYFTFTMLRSQAMKDNRGMNKSRKMTGPSMMGMNDWQMSQPQSMGSCSSNHVVPVVGKYFSTSQ